MTAEQKKKDKELVDRLYNKYYGDKKSKSSLKVPEKKPKEAGVKAAQAKSPSRTELMLQAKAKGIKNFRVINKEELMEILKTGSSKERISEIVNGAVARWKSTWGRGKDKQKTKE
jgi:hypothetical protein